MLIETDNYIQQLNVAIVKKAESAEKVVTREKKKNTFLIYRLYLS